MERRTPNDERQIGHWLNTAGPKSRFRKWLVRLIVEKYGTWDDYGISPKIRQTLQHWGVKLTEKYFNEIAPDYQ